MSRLDSQRVIDSLAELGSKSSSVFGADSHQFWLNPPLPEAVLTAFERKHAISLPLDYRHFLISIGNGGTGPFYGVFPLGKMDDGFDLRDWHENDDFVRCLSEPFAFEQEWNDLTGKPRDELADQDEEEYWKQEERFEEKYWLGSLINGAIPICHEGCALRILLVVTGNQAGFLWEDRRSEYGGLRPLKLADGSQATFASWYEEWLAACLASHP